MISACEHKFLGTLTNEYEAAMLVRRDVRHKVSINQISLDLHVGMDPEWQWYQGRIQCWDGGHMGTGAVIPTMCGRSKRIAGHGRVLGLYAVEGWG